ncbi:hypothetical protein MRB53_031561 [Persea americana]|uniref:Uncharacterized protein n=1 Tax=Persea americana TaxID=3435 RepID=A0ACC2KPR3_PERAE|nr:hypothetical protein MRB53_031561 [Persea americana]
MRSKGVPAQSELGVPAQSEMGVPATSFRPQLASIRSSFSTPTLSGCCSSNEVDGGQQFIIAIFDRIAALLIVDGAVC